MNDVAYRAAAELRTKLTAWFAREQRDLPWRRTRDAYAIWVSEAMLQQTRVETVVAYWQRFLVRFPDVRALADAREEDVLAAWSGLGYYRRARALHAAARAIVERHGGEFPRERDAVLALPGVGPYTAGAVLSIAFDQPEALVDGNVVRVLSRLFARDGDYDATLRWAWEVARELVPKNGGAGAWNQALMELGATVCTPREPKCLLCPVSELCVARKRGLERELPRAKKRKAAIAVELETLVVERDGELLLERRPAGGRMAELWQFPTRQLGSQGLFPSTFAIGVRAAAGEVLGELAHTITHHRIRVQVVRGELTRSALGPEFAWFTREALTDVALTGMARKLVRAGLAEPRAQAARKKLRSVRA